MAAGLTGSAGRIRSPWRHREVRGLLLAQVASELGDSFTRVAVTLLVLDRYRSALLAALVLALSYVPSLLGGVLLGALADRLPRRELMVGCDLVRGALVLGLAAGVTAAPTWVLFAVLLVVELVHVPFDAARNALLPDIVPEPRSLQAAVGTSGTLSQVNMVLGLSLGAVVVATTSMTAALAVDGITYGLSAVLLLTSLASRPRPAGVVGASFLGSVREGAVAVLRHPARRALVGLGWLLGATAIAPEAVALSYAVQHAHPALGGLLLAAVPAGGAVGAAISAGLDPARLVHRLLPLAALSCVPLLLTAVDLGVAVTCALWVLAGFLQGLLLPTIMVLVTLATTPALRGRVSALAGAGFALASAGALAAVGALADRWTASAAVAAAGAIGMLVTAALAMVWPYRQVAAVVPAGGTASGGHGPAADYS